MVASFLLPDLSANWPFRRTLHSHYESVNVASTQWVESFNTLNAKAQASFNRHKFTLLASLAYPHVKYEHLRLACDLLNWFFVFDELSDVEDGASVRNLANSLVNILRDPYKPLPLGCSALERLTQSFWSRTCDFATPSSIQRLTNSLTSYIEAVCLEAEDREQGNIRNIQDYLSVRRETAGPRPCFEFFLLPHDIPEEIMSHPQIQKLTECGMDLIVLANDIYSYNYERAHSLDGHNMISAVMMEKSCDVQSAFNFTGTLFQQTAQDFLDNLKMLPSRSEAIDKGVSEYLFGIGTWVAALHEWSFESERYFGTNGTSIQRSRLVELSSNPSAQQRMCASEDTIHKEINDQTQVIQAISA